MNWFLLISGVVALFTAIGHFTVGRKLFLMPTLKADFDIVAKKIMHCLFHYSSVWLVLSAGMLLLTATGWCENNVLIWFIVWHYALMAVVQLIIALTSGIEKVFSKMFQWIFFVLIALFAALGMM